MYVFLLPSDTPMERWEWLLSHLSENDINSLLGIAYSIVNDKEDAEDVVQNALMIGMLKCDRIQNEDKVFAWMRTTVRRECYAFMKQYHHRNISIIEQLSRHIKMIDSSAEDKVIDKFEMDIVRKAFSQLKSSGKEIIWMYLIEDKSFQEIARLLNKKYNTVRSLYRRAMKELKNNMRGLQHE